MTRSGETRMFQFPHRIRGVLMQLKNYHCGLESHFYDDKVLPFWELLGTRSSASSILSRCPDIKGHQQPLETRADPVQTLGELTSWMLGGETRSPP